MVKVWPSSFHGAAKATSEISESHLGGVRVTLLIYELAAFLIGKKLKDRCFLCLRDAHRAQDCSSINILLVVRFCMDDLSSIVTKVALGLRAGHSAGGG